MADLVAKTDLVMPADLPIKLDPAVLADLVAKP